VGKAAEDPDDPVRARDLCLYALYDVPELLHGASVPFAGARESVPVKAAKFLRDVEGVDQFVALPGQDGPK
jgi:hypothetical protein